jgi:hydrogenase/urease accessory protein HupE
VDPDNEGNDMIHLAKRLYLLFSVVLLLLTAVPVYSHNLPLGGSKWCVGKNGIIATIDLNETLFSELQGIKERHYDLASGTDDQLQQIAHEFIQPYINRKISVSVNNKTYPIKVDRLVRNENSTFTIWLSVNKVAFDSPQNALKLDYRMLFEETSNAHVNLAYLYRSDATGDALQKVFDYTPAAGEYNFAGNSPAWELPVQGITAAPLATPAISIVQPGGTEHIKAEHKQAAAQQESAVSSRPDNRPTVQEKEDVGIQHIKAQTSDATLPAPTQNAQKRDLKDAASNAPAGRNTPEHETIGKEKSIWSTIGGFILLGIEHILTGYDHIAFLIGLIVIGLTTREVLKIITAFTIAHSITLLLAALRVINLNSRFVESVIALSICYIALENLFKKEVKYRWLITFCFGLVHGFGFASALQELIVGKTNLVLSVVSFNFGVETGQLMIFFVLLPVLHFLKQRVEFRKITATVSVAIFLLGFTWLLERLFDLNLISL